MYNNIMSPDCKTAEVTVGKIAPNDVTKAIVGKTGPGDVTAGVAGKTRLGDIAAVAVRLE